MYIQFCSFTMSLTALHKWGTIKLLDVRCSAVTFYPMRNVRAEKLLLVKYGKGGWVYLKRNQGTNRSLKLHILFTANLVNKIHILSESCTGLLVTIEPDR